jgi:hypothetical protein
MLFDILWTMQLCLLSYLTWQRWAENRVPDLLRMNLVLPFPHLANTDDHH